MTDLAAVEARIWFEALLARLYARYRADHA